MPDPRALSRLNEALESGDPVDVQFAGLIRLYPEDVAEAGHNVAQAIQNLVGASGVKVVEISDEF